MKVAIPIKEITNEEMVKRYQLCNDEDEKIAIRNELLERNIGYIHKVVGRKLKNFQDDHDDVVNMAAIKFCRAIEAYKFDKGANFLTYLTYWVDGAVYEYWNEKNLIYIPRGTDFAEGGSANFASNSRLVWLDKDLTNDGEGGTFMDVIANTKSTRPDEEAGENIDIQRMHNIINNQLDRAERLILTYRYLKDIPVTKYYMSKMLRIVDSKCNMIECLATKKLALLLKGRPAKFHMPIKKGLPTDEEIEASYQKWLNEELYKKMRP